jgi:bacillithiol biosynthesis deacetylase BshB1
MSDRGVEVLAIAAHRDDVELTCGGTLVRCVEQGYRTGVIDLTEGEMGTRGSATLRAEEAARAADVLGLAVRMNAGLPDAGLFNNQENRERLATMIRGLRPRVLILPFFRGRHPDHRVAAELGRDAAFLAALKRFGPPDPPAHMPRKILYALSYREDPVKPTFVVHLEGRGRGDLPDRPAPVRARRDAGPPLRLAHPVAVRRAVLYGGDRPDG